MAASAPPVTVPPKESNALLIVLIIVAVVVVLFLLVVLVAALTVPRMSEARRVANQAAAAANVRAIVEAELLYGLTYSTSGHGYAANLAVLGSSGLALCAGVGPERTKPCLVDAALVCPGAASGQACVKNEYQYTITGVTSNVPDQSGKPMNAVSDFVIFATPTSRTAGRKDYCATSDPGVRWRAADNPPSDAVKTVQECMKFSPM